jgi:PAS domain S-box-containing protein
MPGFRPYTLRSRALVLVALVTVPALVIFALSAREQGRLATRGAEQNAVQLALSVADESRYMEDATRLFLTTLARTAELRGDDAQGCSGLLTELLARFPRFVGLAVVTEEGEVVCGASPTPERLQIPNDVFTADAARVEAGEFHPGGIRLIGPEATPVQVFRLGISPFAHAVHPSLIALADLRWLQRFIWQLGPWTGRSVTLADENGRIVLRSPDPEQWTGRRLSETPYAPVLDASEPTGLFTLESPVVGRRRYAYAPLQGPRGVGTVLVGTAEEDLLAAAEVANLRNLLLLFLAAVLGAVGVYVAGIALIQQPIDRLLLATKLVATGDLDGPPSSLGDQGEIGELALAFDRMRESLRAERAESMAAHHARAQSERQYRLVFESSPLPMWVHDRQSLRFLAVNEAAILKYGYSAEEFSRMSTLDILPPHDPRGDPGDGRGIAGADDAAICRHVLRDGSSILVEVTSHEIHFQGRESRLVAANDVTVRERALEAARLAEERQSFAMNAAGVALWELDFANRRLTWAEALNRYFGLDPASAPPTIDSLLRWVHPDDGPAVLARIDAAAIGGGEYRLDFRVLRPAHGVRWVTAHGRTLLDGNGDPVGLLGIAYDITHRKRVEQELRRREQQLIEAQRIAGLGNWELIWGTGEISWSDQMYSIFRRDPADGPLGADEYLAGVHPEDREHVAGRFANLAEGSPERDAEHRFIFPDGSEAVLNVRVSCETDSSGSAVRVFGTVQDVTDRRAYEEAIRASEERYRLVARVTHDVLWDWSPATGAVTWNEMLRPIFGHPPSPEMTSLEWWLENIHPDDRQRVVTGLRASMDEGRETWTDEYRFRRVDGTYAAVLVRAYLVTDSAGTPVRVVGSMLDITERTEREQALRASEERFRQIAENIREVFFMTDARTGKVIYLSPAFAEIWGTPRSEVYADQRAWIRGIHPDDRERVKEALEVHGEANLNIEYRIVRPDGAVRWIWARAFPVEDEQGEVVRIAGLAEDITERKQADQERAELLRRAEATREEAEFASQAKSDFLAVVSHELRTPLTSIISFAEILDAEVAGPVTPEQREQLGMIARSAWHLNSLVNEILEFTRLEGGHEVVYLEATDVAALVAEAASLVAPAAAERGLAVVTAVPRDGVSLHTDQGKLRQILLNLLSNAIKFTEQGQVVVSVEADASAVRISVEDSGPGIAPEHQSHIFEPFWQVENPMTRRVGGAGLGLSIVQHLTRLLGGAITLRTEPGEGSRFTVSFPRSSDVASPVTYRKHANGR